MSVIGSNILAGASGQQGYNISRSVRLRSSASAYFNRTSTSSVTSNTTWTYSFWMKIGSQSTSGAILEASSSGSTGIPRGGIRWGGSNDLELFQYNGSTYDYRQITTQVFRDPSAWYHIVVVADTSNGTAANRMKLYVNNVQVTSWSTNTQPSSSLATYVGSASKLQRIGVDTYNGSFEVFDGYLTEINFIDGQALTPSSFGENDSITGVWKPKKYTGTYGTNGFYLNFSDNSNNTATTIGKDYSGNGNNWTPNNISVTSGVTYDSMLDVPTPYADGGNGRGNYCTINPLDAPTNGSFTISDGNLRTESTSSANRNHVRASIGVASGKWYWEITVVSGDRCQAGVALNSSNKNEYVGYDASGWGIYQLDGNKYNNQGGTSGTAYGSAWTTAGDVLMVALDATNSKLWFGKNGTWFASGDPVAGTNAAFTNVTGGELMPAIGDGSGSGVYAAACNFGQRPFTYTPPSGFVALNTQNLPDSTIKKGNQYFDATTFDGVTGGGSVVNSGGMQPDLVWMKARNNANNHELADSVRGTAYALFSNLTNAEVSDTRVSSFNSNGFSYGTNSNSAVTGRTSVGWQWQAGKGTTSSNTSGSITSTVSVNATAGFSVVAYNSGASGDKTVGHGLGVAPSMIITKSRSSASYNWSIYHASVATTVKKYLAFTTDALQDNGSNIWGSAFPTSSVFGITSGNGVVASTDCIAYCFSAVAGYSAFGSYTGNGNSSDGPFVYLGFRPRFIMTKRTDTTGPWQIIDTSRDTYNSGINGLFPNTSGAEASFTQPNGIDFLSNGFKLRNSSTDDNASGGAYIYAAFAENPTKIALAR